MNDIRIFALQEWKIFKDDMNLISLSAFVIIIMNKKKKNKKHYTDSQESQ